MLHRTAKRSAHLGGLEHWRPTRPRRELNAFHANQQQLHQCERCVDQTRHRLAAACKRKHVSAAVIFAEQFERLIGWRGAGIEF